MLKFFYIILILYKDILNFSKKIYEIILSYEQYYLNLIQPKYNRLKITSFSLDYKYIEEIIIKFSEENNDLFGKTNFPSIIIKLSGKNNNIFERRDNLHLIYVKNFSVKIRTLSRIAQKIAIFVYLLDNTLIKKFNFTKKVKLFFNCSHITIIKYVINYFKINGFYLYL